MELRNLKFGFEAFGVDYNNPKDADIIREKIGEGRFVVIKNKHAVDPSKLISLYKNIGVLGKQPGQVTSAIENYPEICRVRRDAMFHGDETGKLNWHNAPMNRYDGDQLVCMYMHENNCVGGETGFTDAQTAFNDLSDEEKQFWVKQKARYQVNNFSEIPTEREFNNSYLNAVFNNANESAHFVDADGSSPFKKQVEFRDIIMKHPLNNKLGFYFPFVVINSIVNNSNDKLKWLINYLLREKYVYIHQWDLYDLVLSDQIHSLHKRHSYQGSRELWRSGIMYK